jgi:hypothetical protein
MRLHDLRHTHATLLVASGAHPDRIADEFGNRLAESGVEVPTSTPKGQHRQRRGDPKTWTAGVRAGGAETVAQLEEQGITGINSACPRAARSIHPVRNPFAAAHSGGRG